MKISEHALYQRINRKLKQRDEQLRKARGWKAELALGHYYIVDIYSNFAAPTHLDLETLGRELGVIRSWDWLEDTESNAEVNNAA